MFNLEVVFDIPKHKDVSVDRWKDFFNNKDRFVVRGGDAIYTCQNSVKGKIYPLFRLLG